MRQVEKMNEYLSDKLKVLSFVSIILVVYIHMYYTEGATMPVLNFIEGFWGKGICVLAVPLFYIISGYLFFLKCENGLSSIWPKIRKRVRTLLVPYLLMNLFAVLFYVMANLLANSVPSIGGVLNFRIIEIIREMNIWQMLATFFWTDPTAFQLWFVRDLMVVVLFSPLIFLLLRQMTRMKFGILLFIILEGILVALDYYSEYFGAAFWFIAGGYLAMALKIDMTSTRGRSGLTLIAAFLCIVLVLVNIFFPMNWMGWVIPVCGILALWYGYDLLAKGRLLGKSPLLKFLCGYTFFVYLVHEPLLNILKKMPLLVSRSEWMLIAAYVIVPPIFYILAAWLGKGLKGLWPRAYGVFTGGR